MQMRSGAPARIASQTYYFAGFDDLARIYQKTGQMTVIRFQAVRMPDDQQISIPTGVTRHFFNTHHTIKSRPYGIACGQGNVRPPVLPYPSEGIL